MRCPGRQIFWRFGPGNEAPIYDIEISVISERGDRDMTRPKETALDAKEKRQI